MAMADPDRHQRYRAEVIDLVSSDEEPGSPQPATLHLRVQEPDSNDELDARYDTPPSGNATPDHEFRHRGFPADPDVHNPAAGGNIYNVDGEEVFIPDDDPPVPGRCSPEPPAQVQGGAARDEEIALALNDAQRFTVDDCLQSVLDIFPDISHEYVRGLYNGFDEEGDYETLPGQARLDNIIEQLVAGASYPKQEKGSSVLKRKRQEAEEEDSDKKWEQQNRIAVPHFLKGSMQAMLKAEFPDIPVHFINETLATHRHLFQAFIALAKTKDDSDDSNRPYGKGRPSTKQHLADAAIIATNCGWPELLEELNAARRRVQVFRAEKAAEYAKKIAEQENIRRAIEAGETAECSACFEDVPMNRQIHCNGAVAHFTCFECALTYINSEVGESRCRVLCTAGCGAGFPSKQLNQLANKSLLEKLAQLQQEKDIRDAGLDNLEECPFCDYKAILPPIEEDFEFRCANPECEKVSCRRCKSVSHIPVSCEQHAKDKKVNTRHKIEEAMSDALIRSCNRCKKQFVKEYGCNKMSCPSCGNLQCYVCSTTLKGYDHFDHNDVGGRTMNGGPSTKSKKCPLYDNVEERHEREVKEAEAAARAQAVEDNPDLSLEDLEIKVSDAVKKSAADRVRRAGGPAGGFAGVGGIMGGNVFEAFDPPQDWNEFFDPGFDFDGRRAAARAGPPRPNAALAGQQAAMQHRLAERMGIARRELDYMRHPEQGTAGRAPVPPPLPAQAAPPGGRPNGYVGQLQGYIPILGFQNNQPPQPQPQPAAPANILAQGLFGNLYQPQQHNNNHMQRDVNLPFGGMGAQPAPNLNFGAAPNQPAGHQRPAHQPGLLAGYYPPDFVPGAPRARVRTQLGAVTQQPAQPLDDRARARQNFRDLEQLRQQHDLRLLNEEINQQRAQQVPRVDDALRQIPYDQRSMH